MIRVEPRGDFAIVHYSSHPSEIEEAPPSQALEQESDEEIIDLSKSTGSGSGVQLLNEESEDEFDPNLLPTEQETFGPDNLYYRADHKLLERIVTIPTPSPLRALILKDLSIPEIDSETINSLVHLEALDLSGNQLTDIPVLKLRNLEIVSFANNKIVGELKGSVNKIQCCTQLTMLNFSHNRLTRVPVFLSKSLKYLNLSFNHIGRNTSEGASYSRKIEPPPLVEIDLSHNHLRKVPESVFVFTSLQTLILRDNHIAAISTYKLPSLFQLRTLNLSGNQLQNITLTLSSATQLRELDVSRNQIGGLYYNFSDLKNLNKLNLSHNLLDELPEMFASFKELNELNIGHNRFAHFPTCLLKLTQLVILTIADNPIAVLPDRIGQLSSLTRLDLKNTRIDVLPNAFSHLTALEKLDLTQNHFREVPDVVRQIKSLKTVQMVQNLLPGSPENVRGQKIVWRPSQDKPQGCNCEGPHCTGSCSLQMF